MADPTGVELVRVPKEERYYDRDAVLGRDASSVFPTEMKAAAAASGAMLAGLLGGGNKKFISETELEEIKATRGLNAEDGTIAADKPLVEVLREAKEAKEVAFQDQWKTMKQGKNRPLDEDEFEFLDNVAEREAAAMRQAMQEEENELASFYAAQRQQQEGGDASPNAEQQQRQQPIGALGPAPAPEKKQANVQAVTRKQPLVAIKSLVRPVVRVKPTQAQPAASEPASKRQRTDEQQQQQQQQSSGGSEDGPLLAGLLGGYGSDSGEDS